MSLGKLGIEPDIVRPCKGLLAFKGSSRSELLAIIAQRVCSLRQPHAVGSAFLPAVVLFPTKKRLPLGSLSYHYFNLYFVLTLSTLL